MAAVCKVSGLNVAMDDDVVPAVKIKAAGRCKFVIHAFVALTFVFVPCVLLYAPRFSLPTPRFSVPTPHGGATAAFSGQRAGSVDVAAFLGSPVASAGGVDAVEAHHHDGGGGDAAEAHHHGGGGVDAAEAHHHGGGGDVAEAHHHGGGGDPVIGLDNQVGSPCSSMPNHTICCDRTDYHSDVCFLSGDVRTDAATLSLLLFPPPGGAAEEKVERIRPYTRKWDAFITETIHEVTLRTATPDESTSHSHRCDVRHASPALVITAAGYSHNLFHAFNDGILPAWLTSQHLRRRVVLAVLAYNEQWAGRFREPVAGLSDSGVVDLVNDNRTHCFPGAIVGTRYHEYLAVDPARLRDNKTVVDFHDFLARAYYKTTRVHRRSKGKKKPPSSSSTSPSDQTAGWRPRVGLVSRGGRRVIENQAAVVQAATSLGFDVDVMETGLVNGMARSPLSAVYKRVSAFDVLLGVHGADLTAFLFLRPGAAALVQVAPLGISLLSRNLFGVPAARMGLMYEQYDVAVKESSLSRKYPPGHVVLVDPDRARKEQGKIGKEWDLVEFVYLRGQNVSLDLGRFRETMARVHSWLMQRRSSSLPNVSISTEI